ncbi:YgiT-type zinc finger protein [Herbaspirillum sp. RU 5E]|nr:YgiT-type zinc finger protein [Herbaspirillum sp. RU 5E]
MKCPTCFEDELLLDTRSVSYSYKGQNTIFHSVEADFCPKCGEYLTGPAETQRLLVLMKKFKEEVNSTIASAKGG